LLFKNSPLVGALGLLQLFDIPRSSLIYNVKRNDGIEAKLVIQKLSRQLLDWVLCIVATMCMICQWTDF